MTASVNTSAQLQHPIGAKGRFTLRLPSGSVAIRGTDTDTATVRDMTGRPLSDRFEIVTGQDSLELSLRPRFGITIAVGSRSIGSGPSPELEVELPRTADLTIDTASADVRATGMTGPKRFRTASGDLSLEAIGGELEIEAVSGDIRIDTDAAVNLRGRSISGDMRLRAARLGKLEMTTTSGDLHIDAEMAGSGPYSIKSISGDVTLVARAGLEVEAHTITGDLSSGVAHRIDTTPGRKLLIVGKPVATLSFKSVSGDLEVVEPRDQARAERPAPATPSAPGASAVPAPPAPPVAPVEADPSDAVRLGILQALERGELSVEDASRQLTALEEG